MDDGSWSWLCEQWPGVIVPRAEFEAFVRMRCSTKAASSNRTPVRPQTLSDLFIVYACGRGDARAIRLFGDRFGAVLEGVRRRFGARAPRSEELLADVEQRLFAPREGAEPRILAFGGQADLSSWLKVVATRILLNRLEGERTDEPIDEGLLEGLGLAWESPEHLLHREEARAHFRSAFGATVAELSARDRKLLRLAFVDGLTIDDLGALYGVHRTTAYRRLKQATDRLASALRARLREALQMTDAEYDSWCQSLRSALEVSVRRHLPHDDGRDPLGE